MSEATSSKPMSLRAYAKHRAELGLVGATAMAVSKAIKAGRLRRSVTRDASGDPKIADAELADREWEVGTDHSKAPSEVKARAAAGRLAPGSGTGGAVAGSALPPPPPARAPGARWSPGPVLAPVEPRERDVAEHVEEPTDLNIAEESAREKFWKAHLAELEYRKKSGELMAAKEVEGKLVDLFGRCRTKLLGVPSRARQQDPALTAAQLALLEALIREALEDLAGEGEQAAAENARAAAP